MDFLSKYVKKSGKSEKESELEIQLENLQEKYNVLKESHEYTVKMLEEAKKGDNSVLQAYNRLKVQFEELSHFVSVKKTLDFGNVIKQQAEICKQRDLLNAKEQELNEKEKKISLREHVIQLLESGKSIEDLVEENQILTEKNKQLLQNISDLKNSQESHKQKLKRSCEKILKCFQQTKSSSESLQSAKDLLSDYQLSTKPTETQILETLQKKFDSKSEESKKLEKSDAKKTVIPLSFKKKPSLPLKPQDLDLEKELGNSFNH